MHSQFSKDLYMSQYNATEEDWNESHPKVKKYFETIAQRLEKIGYIKNDIIES